MPDLSFQGIKNALMLLLGQSEGEDAVTMLIADHRRVKDIFDSFKDLDDDEKMSAMHKALVELALHAVCEEKLVYPLMREEGESEKEEVDEAVEEHHLMKVLMKELEMMSGVNDRLKAKFKVLGEIVQHHVEEEEHDMFPKLRSADDIDLQALGQKIAAKKEELLAKLGDDHNLGLIDPELVVHPEYDGNGTANAGSGTKAKAAKPKRGAKAKPPAAKTVLKSASKKSLPKSVAKKSDAKKSATGKKKAATRAKKIGKTSKKSVPTTRKVSATAKKPAAKPAAGKAVQASNKKAVTKRAVASKAPKAKSTVKPRIQASAIKTATPKQKPSNKKSAKK